MLDLFSEIVDLMSESARMATGESTLMPSAQLVRHCNRYLEYVPGEPLIHRFLEDIACHAAVAEPLG